MHPSASHHSHHFRTHRKKFSEKVWIRAGHGKWNGNGNSNLDLDWTLGAGKSKMMIRFPPSHQLQIRVLSHINSHHPASASRFRSGRKLSWINFKRVNEVQCQYPNTNYGTPLLRPNSGSLLKMRMEVSSASTSTKWRIIDISGLFCYVT